MNSFTTWIAEDAFGNFAAGDVSRGRSSSGVRPRTGFRSESHESGMRRNNSDTSIGDKNGQGNDSGIDTAVSYILPLYFIISYPCVLKVLLNFSNYHLERHHPCNQSHPKAQEDRVLFQRILKAIKYRRTVAIQ